MAIVKVEIRPKGDGSYADVIHPQTSANQVLISDSGNKITATEVESALVELVDKIEAIKAIKTASITTTWVGASAPYTQEVIVAGVTVDDEPVIVPIYSATLATAILQKTAWNLIDKAVTGTGIITFTCFSEKPVTAIPIQIKGV